MAVLSAAVTGSFGGVFAAALAVDAGQDSAVTVAIIGTVGGLGIAVVTGVFALVKDRRSQAAVDPSRHIPEAADLLAAEMKRVDQLRGQVDRLRKEVDTWQERAYQAGWRP